VSEATNIGHKQGSSIWSVVSEATKIGHETPTKSRERTEIWQKRHTQESERNRSEPVKW